MSTKAVKVTWEAHLALEEDGSTTVVTFSRVLDRDVATASRPRELSPRSRIVVAFEIVASQYARDLLSDQEVRRIVAAAVGQRPHDRCL